MTRDKNHDAPAPPPREEENGGDNPEPAPEFGGLAPDTTTKPMIRNE